MADTATATGRKDIARRGRSRGRRGLARPFAGLRVGDLELLLVACLLGLAILVRWPNLLLMPHFTDEIVEVGYAAKIAAAEHFPLTAQDTYFGPLHAYILAALLKLFGPSVALPRLVIMVFGAFTVLATYLLGRELAGRAVGVVAAALLLTSPQHILVNSHISWQHSTMPLYSTLCCWAFVRSLRAFIPVESPGGQGESSSSADSGDPKLDAGYLVLAGFLFGLTLQTHPGAIVLIPALAATLLATLRPRRFWRLLCSPWPYVSVFAALAAYSPLLIFNLTNKLVGLNRVLYQRDYVYETNPSWAHYRENAAQLSGQLLRMISDPTRLPPSASAYLASPYLLITLGLCLAGFVLLIRRGQWLPFFLLVSTLLIIPRYLKAYVLQSVYHMSLGRYVTYLLPFLYVAIACAAVAAAGAVLRSLARRPAGPQARWVAAALAIALILCLVLYPLLPLRRFYAEAARADPDNPTFFAMLREIESLRGERTPILVDSYLDRIEFDQGVSAGEVIDYLLTMEGIPHRAMDDPQRELAQLVSTLDPADPGTLPLVIMMRDRCWRIRDQVPLQRAGERLRLRELYRDLPSYFAIYRYTPSQPSSCHGPEGPQPGD